MGGAGLPDADPALGEVIARARRSSKLVRAYLVGTAIAVCPGVLIVGAEVRFNWLPEMAETFALGADPDLDAVNWSSFGPISRPEGSWRRGCRHTLHRPPPAHSSGAGGGHAVNAGRRERARSVGSAEPSGRAALADG